MFRNSNAILIALCLFLASLSTASAQDVIFLRTGDEVKVVVKEVTETSVKYNKFDNKTGPVYSVDKDEVMMIKYENGSKDVFAQKEKKKKSSDGDEDEEEQEKSAVQKMSGERKSYLNSVAQLVSEQVLDCCSNRKENGRHEVYYDGIIDDPVTGDTRIPIRVSWVGRFEAQRWVRGFATVTKDKRLGWVYQSDGGGIFGCAKDCQVKSR
jgi:ribosomal protein L21E